jgi:hypothetical protein
MLWMGFEPTIPALERAKTVHASDSATTVIGLWYRRPSLLTPQFQSTCPEDGNRTHFRNVVVLINSDKIQSRKNSSNVYIITSILCQCRRQTYSPIGLLLRDLLQPSTFGGPHWWANLQRTFLPPPALYWLLTARAALQFSSRHYRKLVAFLLNCGTKRLSPCSVPLRNEVKKMRCVSWRWSNTSEEICRFKGPYRDRKLRTTLRLRPASSEIYTQTQTCSVYNAILSGC